MEGVHLVRLTEHRDRRGSLIALDEEQGLTFTPQRVFFTYDCSTTASRADHASNCDETLIATMGSVTVDVDNTHETSAYRLDDRRQVLMIQAGVWLRLRNFAPDTILLVAASRTYSATRHYRAPQSYLFSAARRAA
jgi:dTDP-4-dehydrorhamnose 3,5-epimerase-like enzyme